MVPSSACDKETPIIPESPQVPAVLLPIPTSTTLVDRSGLWAERPVAVSPCAELVTALSHVSAGHGVKLASVFPQPESLEVKLDSSPSPHSSPSLTRVSPSQLQLHRLAIGVIEMLSYSGFIFTCEWIVALSFPNLRSCGQVTASWSEFLLSVFDLLSS
jgi:hypothetical protein